MFCCVLGVLDVVDSYLVISDFGCFTWCWHAVSLPEGAFLVYFFFLVFLPGRACVYRSLVSTGSYRILSSSPGFACCFFTYTGGYWAGTLLLGAFGSGGGLSISTSCSSRKATRFDLLAGASVLVSSSRSGL